MKTNLIKVLKGGLFGFLGGALYAFISFYLITPMLHQYAASIAGYGLQGFILGVVYMLLNLLFKMSKREGQKKIIANLMIGMASGIITSAYGVILTYYSILRFNGSVTDELKASIVLRITQTIIGYALIGLIVGLLIGLIERKAVHSRTTD